MSHRKQPRWVDLSSRSRHQIERDVAGELDAWIAERAAELVRTGLSPDEARARARVEFGDVAAARRYCVDQDMTVERRTRITRWASELADDAHHALRSFARTPALSLVVVVTFALGIGATTAIFGATHALLLRPLPYADADHLFYLRQTDRGTPNPVGQLSAATLVALRQGVPAMSGIAAMGLTTLEFSDDGDPESLQGGRVTANAFDVLGARPELGRTFVVGEDSSGAEPVVVLSDSLWRRRFGADPTIVGRVVRLSGTMRRVVGVMPRGFFFPTMGSSELWIPLDLGAAFSDPNRAAGFRFLRVFGRIANQTTTARVQGEIDRVMQSLGGTHPTAFAGIGARLEPLRRTIAGDIRPMVFLLMGASIFVLVIACANVSGVLLARTMARRPELAIRAALGAGRARIVRLVFVESLVLAIVAGACGVALAFGGVRVLGDIAASALPAGMEIRVDPLVLLFGLGLIVTSGIAFALAPALTGARDVGGGLRDSGVRGGTGARVRHRQRLALVSAQIAFCVALLAGAILLTQSLMRVAALDLGYRTDQVLTFRVSLPSSRYDVPEKEDQFWNALYERVASIPGVMAVGSSGSLPLVGGSTASLAIDGRPTPDGRLPEIGYANASDDYFKALEIPLLRGRAFGRTDRGDNLVVLVSASAARQFWGSDDPIGARVRLGPNPDAPWFTVVGVVGDVRQHAEGDARATVYVNQRVDHWGGGSVVVRASGDPLLLSSAVRAAVRDVDPLLPVNGLRSLEEYRSLLLTNRRLPVQLMSSFAVVALVLAAVGVYGMTSQAVAARTREFGIRLALGASRRRVLADALGEGGRSLAIGLAVGLPLALGLAWKLQSLLYDVRPFDVATFAAVAVVLGVAVVAASLIPARRATSVDPARTLREE